MSIINIYLLYNCADPTLRCSDFLFMDLAKNYPSNNYIIIPSDYSYQKLYPWTGYDDIYKQHYNLEYKFNYYNPDEMSIIDSIIFSNALPYIVTNNIPINNVIILDDGTLERLYFINDRTKLELYLNYIKNNLIIIGNKNFYNIIKDKYNIKNIIQSEFKIDFSRLNNIVPTSNYNCMSAMENEDCIPYIDAILNSGTIKCDTLYLTDRYFKVSDMKQLKIIKLYADLKMNKRVKLIESKYLQSNIEQCYAYVYFRYDSEYSFMVRSVWEFFYTDRYMYWMRKNNQTNDLDGFNYYIKYVTNKSSEEYSNKLFTVDKRLIEDKMQLDPNSYFLGEYLK